MRRGSPITNNNQIARNMTAGAYVAGHPESLDAPAYIEARLRMSAASNPASISPSLDRPLVNHQSRGMAAVPDVDRSVTREGSARKSLEQIGGFGVQRGLPSPAPSDENTNSPVVPGAAVPARAGKGRGRLSTSNPVVLDTSGSQTRASSSWTPYPLPNLSTPDRGVIPSQSPLGSSAHSSTMQPATLSRLQSPQVYPQQPPIHISLAFNTTSLVHMVDAKLNEYQAKDPAGLAFHVGFGRLRLLKDALHSADWFYIVLSQLYCQQSVAPMYLPPTAQALGPAPYDVLDSLLCPNKNLEPELLAWLANFPGTISSICFSPAAEPYKQWVQRVISFLGELPTRWRSLLADSERLKAPPLVRDLVEQLGLQSPVLQTAAFRVIVRQIWGCTGDGEGCVDHLITVHQWDQAAYARGQTRTQAQKESAYAGYREVYRTWMQYAQAVTALTPLQDSMPMSERQGYARTAYCIPSATQIAFGMTLAPVYAPSRQHVYATMQSPRTVTAVQQQSNQARPQQPWGNVQGQSHTFNTVHIQSPQTIVAQHVPSPPGHSRQSPAGPGVGRTFAQAPTMNRRMVFPRAGAEPRAQSTHPDPRLAALHQAGLRSPRLGPAIVQTGMSDLYRQPDTPILPPVRLNGTSPVQTFTFNMPSDLFERRAETRSSPLKGELASRILAQGTTTYRLRCIRDPPSGSTDKAALATADNLWPESVYFEMNGTILETRRKLQYGRYLPIDVTTMLKEGENAVKVIVNRSRAEQSQFDFAIAVESICVLSHESIVSGLTEISAEDSLASIKQALAGEADADDDLVMTSSTVVIKLFDPFSGSKIFDTPVRGKLCQHRDCFDLETYLGIAKRDNPGWPTVVDTWRCPICRGDARPKELVKDGFLVQVREELAEKGLLATRAIIVESDGTWQPKVEDRTGVRSSSLEREERDPSAAAVKAASKPSSVIIELD